MSPESTDPHPILPPRVRNLTGPLPDSNLEVIAFAGHIQSGKQRFATWRCLCLLCGKEKVLRANYLLSGKAKSCGCLARTLARDLNRSHGMFRSPEYTVWMNMKKRCLASGYRRFPDYGGRGITICARWLESFEDFFADMGPRPSAKHSIERKDNDGNYEPDNCIWGTRSEQDSNKRTNRLVTFRGETLTVKEWSRRTGLNHETIRHRLLIGWTAERALTTPPGATRRKPPS